MRRSLLVITIVLVVALDARAATSVPMPSLAAGDGWVLEGGGDTTYENVTARETVNGVDSWRTDLVTLNTSNGTSAGNSTTWVRASDGALVRSSFSSAQGQVVTEYDPPCAELRWPLAAGATWSVRCPSNTSFQGSITPSTLVENVSVSAGTSIQTPAGTFDTVRVIIESPDTPPFATFYAADACTHVRAESGDLVTVLKSQRCSGARSPAPSSPATLATTPASGTQKPAPAAPTALGLALVALLAIAKKRS